MGTAAAIGHRAAERTRRPGEPGVRLRCYVDLRQELAGPENSAG
ncbi:DUF6207 family protein [Streptomyces nogalater]